MKKLGTVLLYSNIGQGEGEGKGGGERGGEEKTKKGRSKEKRRETDKIIHRASWGSVVVKKEGNKHQLETAKQ